MDTTASTKASLRATLRARRRAIAPDVRAAANAAAQANVVRLLQDLSPRRIGLYRPFDGETETGAVRAWADAQARPALFPRHARTDEPMVWVEPSGWRAAPVGPEQPEGVVVAPPGDGDAVVLPAVALDAAGYRLGLGAGYYDRFLSTSGAVSIGLAYAWQVDTVVPRDRWDQPVDWIVTDASVHRCAPAPEPNTPENH